MDRIKLVWAHLNDVLPNPLNPRKDYSTKSTEMQRIIKDKGWEAGITCYRKEAKYIILSGHRRWFAAKQLGTPHIPVIEVRAPISEKEELERLGSIQGGKVDWTIYEWAKYTYEMWIIWNKCSFSELALKMGISSKQIAIRVKVFQYYPHNEIEEKLANGVYSLSALYSLIGWLDKLDKYKSSLVSHYKIELIRVTMLNKIENKLVSVSDLRNEMILHMSSEEQIKQFLLNPKAKLLDILSEDNIKYKHLSKLRTHVKKIENTFLDVNRMEVVNTNDANSLQQEFNKLRLEIVRKQEELRDVLERN